MKISFLIHAQWRQAHSLDVSVELFGICEIWLTVLELLRNLGKNCFFTIELRGVLILWAFYLIQ